MPQCSKCGTSVPEGTGFCPNCGQAVAGAAAPAAQTGGMESHVAAALAYFWITAILWLVMAPYNKDRFVRFHSFQALALGIVWFVISIVLGMIPILGWLILIFLPLIILIVFLLCIFKAYSKEWFKLPIIGDWAEKQAGQM